MEVLVEFFLFFYVFFLVFCNYLLFFFGGGWSDNLKHHNLENLLILAVLVSQWDLNAFNPIKNTGIPSFL